MVSHSALRPIMCFLIKKSFLTSTLTIDARIYSTCKCNFIKKKNVFFFFVLTRGKKLCVGLCLIYVFYGKIPTNLWVSYDQNQQRYVSILGYLKGNKPYIYRIGKTFLYSLGYFSKTLHCPIKNYVRKRGVKAILRTHLFAFIRKTLHLNLKRLQRTFLKMGFIYIDIKLRNKIKSKVNVYFFHLKPYTERYV